MPASSAQGEGSDIVPWVVAGTIISLLAGGMAYFISQAGPKNGKPAHAPAQPAAAQPSAFNVDMDEEELKKTDAAPAVDYEPAPDRKGSLGFVENKQGIDGAKARPRRDEGKPGVVAKVLRGTAWAVAFVKDPRGFMRKNTLIGDPRAARTYLSDPEKVERYLNLPSTKFVLNNPKAAAALLRVPGVADIVFKSPAAKDNKVMQALVDSGILDAAVRSPTGQAMIRDPGMMGRIISDPEAGKVIANPVLAHWLAANPDVMQALGRAGR